MCIPAANRTTDRPPPVILTKKQIHQMKHQQHKSPFDTSFCSNSKAVYCVLNTTGVYCQCSSTSVHHHCLTDRGLMESSFLLQMFSVSVTSADVQSKPQNVQFTEIRIGEADRESVVLILTVKRFSLQRLEEWWLTRWIRESELLFVYIKWRKVVSQHIFITFRFVWAN